MNFEGIYFDNKKWNGKIKERNSFYDKIEFEGEYLNGKKNGNGKEYYLNGNIKFEGEYLNGKKWNGKGYDPLTKELIYELKNGAGFVKEFNFEGLLNYEGEYINGDKGKGKIYLPNGYIN